MKTIGFGFEDFDYVISEVEKKLNIAGFLCEIGGSSDSLMNTLVRIGVAEKDLFDFRNAIFDRLAEKYNLYTSVYMAEGETKYNWILYTNALTKNEAIRTLIMNLWMEFNSKDFNE